MAVAEPGDFFKQKRNAAEIKAEILLPYFIFWAKHKLNNSLNPPATPLLYLDLQAGVGYDAEEQLASPLLTLKAIADSTDDSLKLNEQVQMYFYDAAEPLLAKLQENITALPYIESLIHAPVVLQDPETQSSLINQVKQGQPTLVALDPFSGGFSGEIITAARQGENNTLFMLFTYSKMRQALLAAEPNENIKTLFRDRLIPLQNKDRLEKRAKKREMALVQEWETILNEAAFFTFTFKINLPGKDQTSHYLTLASKNKVDYLGIKELLYAYGEVQEDGVPLFFANQKPQPPLLPGFFQFFNEYCLDNLISDLAQKKSQFHYQTVQDIYEEHSVGTHYIKSNYLTALAKLNQMGHIDLVDINNKKVKQITDATVVFYKLHRPKK
jgi:three-Cys-motif partner protein